MSASTPPHREVGGQEDVGVPERPHRDVVGGPRPDAGQRQQRTAYVVAVGAAVEHDAPLGQGGRQPDERAPPGARHRQGLRVRRRRGSRASGNRCVSPGTGESTGRPCSATMRPADRPGAGDADLLADHRADRRLVAVDLAGHAEAGRRPHERRRARGRRRGARRRRRGRSRRRGGGVRARSAAAVSRRSCEPELGDARTRSPTGRQVGELEPHGAGAVRQVEGAGVPAAARPPRRPARRGRRGSRAAGGRRRACGRPAASSPRRRRRPSGRGVRAARSARRRRSRAASR